MTSHPSTASAAATPLDPEPVRRTIEGVELVTIPLDHYAELLACRRLVAENNLRQGAPPGAAGRIDRDPEVATFLVETFAGRSLHDVYALCVERFGTERSPSRLSIQRFRERVVGSARSRFRVG